MTPRPLLRQLADQAGIIPEYIDCTGQVHAADDATRELLLAAMGFDASSEDGAQHGLDDLDTLQCDRLLDATRVLPTTDATPITLPLRLVGNTGETLDWHAELCEENGEVFRSQGQLPPLNDQQTAELQLPHPAHHGYHTLRITVRGSQFEKRGEQTLIITPQTCHTPKDAVGDNSVFGLWGNLYTLRSKRNWGVGNLGDLQRLVRWAGDQGAGFVGLNPLHHHGNAGNDISPYLPESRFYRNPIYLEIEAIPELDDCAQARKMIASADFQTELKRVRSSKRIDYQGIAKLQRPILQLLYQTFKQEHRNPATERGLAFAEYVSAQGVALKHFATFQALKALHQRNNGTSPGWQDWPVGHRDAHSRKVDAFCKQHADDIEFHCYVQFELDRQLASVAVSAEAAGMALGLYQDLALGTAPWGVEPWAYPDLFVTDASIGAPPDPLGPQGQDWALPPVHPLRLKDSGYWYWIQLLRCVLADGAAVRIDHVMGLTRQYWIPAGQAPAAGAYVRYPGDDLFAILALESRRHEALVVGEDLGTVAPQFREKLARWGILSNQVMVFERDHDGGFLPAERYSNRALVTVNTHDLAPLACFWNGRDVDLRRDLGLYPAESAYTEAQAQRQWDRQALLQRLKQDGLLGDTVAPSYAQLCAAVHGFLRRTPAPLVGISLDDIAGETDPINIPGIDPSDYPCWSRRMSVSLEELPTQPAVKQTMSVPEPAAPAAADVRTQT